MSYEVIVAVVYVCGMFMNIMDSTIVNTALPAIAQQFNTTPAAADWVVIGYLLSLAVWIPASGWVGDRVGTKKTFLFALALFTGASILCGLAGSLSQLVIFRILQGVGGGMLTPVGQTMLWRAYPPQRRAQASAVLMLATVLAPASGPVIGGLLVTQLSWRWVFFVNVPIGVGAFLFGLLKLTEHREPKAGGFDVPGFVLTGLGLALLLYAISEGPLVGWGSPNIIIAGLLGIAGVAMLVRTELRKREPMLNFRLLKDRLFLSTNVVSFLGGAAFLGVLFVMPQFLQEVRGASALSSGLTTFPEAIGVIISSRLVARIYPTVGPRRLMFGGLLFVTAAMALLVFVVNLHTNFWAIRFLMFAIGAGWAYVALPMQAASFAGITSADTGRASAIFNTQRQAAGAVGVALLSTVLASMLPEAGRALNVAPVAQIPAYHAAFIVSAVIALIAALYSLKIRDVDAANTMRPRPPVRMRVASPAAE